MFLFNRIINKRIFKSDFIRNVLTLMTGTTIAQVIPIAILPILTRIYSPEDFGIFALYMSITSILSVIATARYELAIMLPENDNDAKNVAVLSLLVSASLSFIFFLLFFIFNGVITNFFGNPELSNWLYLVPLSVLFTGIYQTLNYWSNRKKDYKLLAINRVLKTTSTSVTNIILGYSKSGIIGLIGGAILGQIIATVLLGWSAWKKTNLKKSSISGRLIRQNAKKYIEYPMYSTPTALLDTASLQAPVFFLGKFFESYTVGFFNLTLRVISGPASIVSSALSQVFYQKISSLKNNNQPIKPFLLKTILGLLMISLFPLVIFVFFAPNMFSIIFGEEWRIAGEYAQVLSIAFAVRFVVSPLSTIFLVLEQVKKIATWQTLYFITTMIVLVISMNYNIETFILVYTVHEVLLYLFYLFLMFKEVNKYSVNVMINSTE